MRPYGGYLRTKAHRADFSLYHKTGLGSTIVCTGKIDSHRRCCFGCKI